MPSTRSGKLAGQKRQHDDCSDGENEPPSNSAYVQIGTRHIKLGKTVETLRKQVQQMAECCHNYLGDKRRLAQENKELQKEMADLVKTGGKGPKNDAVCKQIRDVCLQKVFRLKKFMQDENEEKNLSKFIYDELHPVGNDEEVDEEAKRLWVDCYRGEVTNKVNYVRSYKQQRMKEAAMVYHKQHKHIPSLALLEKCAFRQIDYKNEEEVRVFQWYWDVLCRKYFAICPLLFAQLVATNIHFAPHSQGRWS